VRDGLLLVAHMHQMMSTGGSKALFGWWYDTDHARLLSEKDS
jgi:hypothetical protein